MTAIIDYGVGNLFSLCSSFKKIGEEAVVTSDVSVIRRADRIVFPGVGAFRDASKKLAETGLGEVLKEEAAKGKPIIGMCLGMQLLFERSFEYGEYEGVGIIKGSIRPLSDVVPGDLKIPQMGWNALEFRNGTHPLFKYIKEGDYVYFVHSYYGTECEEDTIAVTEYGVPVTAAVAHKNVMGCQFHPEKSGDVGLAILRAFCEMKEGSVC